MGFGNKGAYGFGSGKGTGGGGGGSGITATPLRYVVGNVSGNDSVSYTNAALVGATILEPVGIMGNVYVDFDPSSDFESSTGTITYPATYQPSEGDIITLTYTKPV